MKHCLIHHHLIKIELNSPASSPQLKQRALIAAQTIENLLKDETKETVIYEGDPRKIAAQFNSGDSVLLYGAYFGMCLSVAYNELKNKGVQVDYHPEGCI